MTSKLKVDEIVDSTDTGSPSFPYGVTFAGIATATNLSYTGTLTGGTGVINIGSGQVYKDASGNVGIGTSSPSRKLQVTDNSDGYNGINVANTNGGSSARAAIVFDNGASYCAIGQKGLGNGANSFLEAAGPFTISVSGSERMRIDSSGNLLVGGTSNFLNARFISENASGNQIALRYSGVSTYYQSIDSSGNFAIAKDGSERMRIDSSGNLLVGTTSSTLGGAVTKLVVDYSTSAGMGFYNAAGNTGAFINFFNISGFAGQITQSGATVSYTSASDIRLKENIVDAPEASSLIDAIRVRSFDWKADGFHQRYGMVAQELESVAPEAVTKGQTEDDMWAVDYSKLVPMLLKEIQSLRKRVAQLEGA